MVTSLQSLTVLVCLVFVPHSTSAFFRRPGLTKRSGSGSGSRKTPFIKNKIFFRENGFLDPVIGEKGGSLVLECQIGGTYNPTIHWLKDGDRIIQSDRHTIADDEAAFERHGQSQAHGVSQTTSRLYIDCLDARDAGSYTCVAENPTLRRAQTTVVSIEKEDSVLYPTLKKCKGRGGPRKGEEARIYLWSTSRLEYEGLKIQLYCRAEGYPAPTITWYDGNNLPITDGGQYELASNGDLIIDNISWAKNMGIYTCVADNNRGSDAVTTFVYPMTNDGNYLL